ncbi:MAG: hypothetical protein LC772_11115, partial [Chloroflexi bacterium]|nr:hypothetical protein [Chloroflexota bacterium]
MGEGQHVTPAALADFDRNAAVGERLAPHNAYFPLMRAVGLFAGHRDCEAMEAIERASQKSVWNDYTAEESAATVHFYNLAFGRSSAITRTSLDYQILLPHLSQLRAVAKMAAFCAMNLEQGGKPQDGLDLRLAVIRCGSLMRVQSNTFIGSLVGIAIAQIAGSRPGGTPAIRTFGPDRGLEHSRLVQAQWLAYLKHAATKGPFFVDQMTVQQVAAENAAGKQARDIIHRVTADGSFTAPAARLTTCWLIGLALLSNGLWLLILSGAAGLRWRRPEGNAPFFCISAVSGLMVILPWQSASCVDLMALRSLFCGDGSPQPAFLSSAGIYAILVPLAVPLTLLLAMSVMSLCRRENLSVGLCQRLRTTGMTAACTLLVLYGGMVAATARYEA